MPTYLEDSELKIIEAEKKAAEPVEEVKPEKGEKPKAEKEKPKDDRTKKK